MVGNIPESHPSYEKIVVASTATEIRKAITEFQNEIAPQCVLVFHINYFNALDVVEDNAKKSFTYNYKNSCFDNDYTDSVRISYEWELIATLQQLGIVKDVEKIVLENDFCTIRFIYINPTALGRYFWTSCNGIAF